MSVSASLSSMARRRVSKFRPPGAWVATVFSSTSLAFLDTTVSTEDCSPPRLRGERLGDRLPTCFARTLQSCWDMLGSADPTLGGALASLGEKGLMREGGAEAPPAEAVGSLLGREG